MTAISPTFLKEKRYRIRRARAGAPLWVDVTPYRAQLLEWRRAGWSYPAIALAVGLDVATIQRISGNDTTNANQHVFRETAAKIGRPDWSRVTGRVMVPALGARRRLQALARIGWTQTAISAEIGMPRGTINGLLYSTPSGPVAPQIMADTHRRIAAAYGALAARPQQGRGADRARNHAARKKWPSPLAWDDIDNPDEQPQGIRDIRKRNRGRMTHLSAGRNQQ